MFVESGDDVVPVVGSCVAIGLVCLTTKVAEEDGGRVREDEKGMDHISKCSKVFHCRRRCRATRSSWSGLREVVRAA